MALAITKARITMSPSEKNSLDKQTRNSDNKETSFQGGEAVQFCKQLKDSKHSELEENYFQHLKSTSFSLTTLSNVEGIQDLVLYNLCNLLYKPRM